MEAENENSESQPAQPAIIYGVVLEVACNFLVLENSREVLVNNNTHAMPSMPQVDALLESRMQGFC